MKDIYQTYDAVQLAADEVFIRWVRLGMAEDEAAWQAWLELHPGKRQVVAEAVSLVKGIRFNPQQPDIDKDRLWSRIQVSSRKPAEVRPIGGRRRFLFGVAGAAAAAIALVLFVIFGIDRPHGLQTAFEEHITQVLPDQSRVQLNADSRLSYDATGRRVELEGEAFFEVEKGGDFIVETPLGQVQVLGTQFNVFSRDDHFQVQCTEGRVRVTAPTDPEGVILTPGMACFVAASGQLETVTLSGLETEIGWLKDIFRFRDQAMQDVFREMERQFGVSISASDQIQSRLHTGFFAGGNLEQALQNICWPQKLNFAIEGKKISITEDVTE